MTIFPKILEEMKKSDIQDVLLFGGGIISEADIKKLRNLGVGELFTPGTPTDEVVGFLNNWVKEHPREFL
jgi:methylmalonyl-CoA mutase C-terminal domain/subunit